MEPLEEGEFTGSTGTMPPGGSVDPNGLQTSATVAAAGGLLLLSNTTDETVASALGLAASPEVFTAGFSLAAFGQLGVFTAGLVLVGLSIVLNVASLTIRWQHWFSQRRIRKYKK